MTLQIREAYVNQTKGHHITGWSEWYEPFTETRKRLFRALQRDLGRCASKMYIDVPNDKPVTCGWVFEKKQEYTDTHDTYIQETWVELREVEGE